MVKIICKPKPNSTDVARLQKELHIGTTVAELLLQRGFSDTEFCKKFLTPSVGDMSDPFLLSGMKEAVEEIRSAISGCKNIVIFGDYDCDGIGATAILYLTLKKLGAKVSYFIPERKSDGYGISWGALTRLFETVRAELIVSVDCGISSYQEIERAKSVYGAEFIITDHHELPVTLPDAIMVNPHFGSETDFSGAGVALKLSEALTDRVTALQYVDICALSTVADVVPLTGENRIIVKEGLRRFSKREIRPGLRELLRVSGIEASSAVTSYDIGFKLAPRLNASGRLESAQKSIELLVEEDVSTLRLLADALNEDNRIRQEKTEEVFQAAKNALKDYDIAHNHMIILADKNWDAGVLGIAAARIAEVFRRPTVLLTESDGIYSGSARSVGGIHLYETLSCASELLIKFGGHAAAAGLSLKKENLEAFRETCRKVLDNNADVFSKLDFVYTDFDTNSENGVAFYKELERLEPYGMGNPKPIARFIGNAEWTRINTKPHLKARISADAELVAFSAAEMLALWSTGRTCFAVSPEISVYRNVARASLFVRNFDAFGNILTEEILAERYFKAFLSSPREEKLPKRPSSRTSGRLIVTYTQDAYLKAQRQFPEYRCFSIKSDTLSPDNAIVLSPDEATEFSYFNEIIFLERPPETFLRYLDGVSGAVTVAGDFPNFPAALLDVEQLRNLYVFMKQGLGGKIFTSIGELWSTHARGFYDRLPYSVAFLAFQEIGLISIDKSGMIHINGGKVDLSASSILRSIHVAT